MSVRYLLVLLLASLVLPRPAGAQTLNPISDPKTGKVFAVQIIRDSSPEAFAAKAIDPRLATVIADDFVSENKELLRVGNPTMELLPGTPEEDSLGKRQKYFQRHQGIPVFTGELTVQMDSAGQVTYVKTKMVDDLPADVTPRINRVRAVGSALGLARKDAVKTRALYRQTSLKLTTAKVELMILPLGELQHGSATSNAKLAWKIDIVDQKNRGEAFAKTYFIDAQNGAKLFEIDGKNHLTRQIYDCAGGTGATCQLDGQSTIVPGYYHGRSEGQPVRGAYPSVNPYPTFYWGSRDVDTVYSAFGTYNDYYSTTFGINGPNGFGGIAIWPSVNQTVTRAVAHADTNAAGGNAGCPDNGYYNTSTGTVYLCKGSTVTDLSAHEYSHAIVFHSYKNASGVPVGSVYSGDSGALNEAYADFMGEILEKYVLGATSWTFADLMPRGPYRSLIDPRSVGSGIGGVTTPDRTFMKYCGTLDANGVHVNSTIVSHAFYLISQGGEHNGCQIQGQGTDVAQKIYFRALRNYLSSNASFNEAYTDFIQACNDLYSANVCAEVTKALQAAEMNQAGSCVPSAVEAAPACAIHGEGIVKTTFKQTNRETTTFAPNTQIWLKGKSGLAGRTVKYFLQPHSSAPAVWSAITQSPSGSATVDPNGNFALQLGTASTAGSYDVLVDGNNDGFYQPWADTFLTYTVSAPVAGDSVCYQGDSYSTSENCNSSPSDCACPAGSICRDARFGAGSPLYQCWINSSNSPS